MNKLIASVFAFSALCFALPAAHAIQASIVDPAALAKIAEFRRSETAGCGTLPKVNKPPVHPACDRRPHSGTFVNANCQNKFNPFPRATCLAAMEAKIKVMLETAPRTSLVAPK